MKSVQIRSFFWSILSRIRTEYGEMLRISSYSIRIREKTDQKNSVSGHFSCSLCRLVFSQFFDIRGNLGSFPPVDGLKKFDYSIQIILRMTSIILFTMRRTSSIASIISYVIILIIA